jgi:hypothetical protein
MSYGLNIELIGISSKLLKQWKVRISKKDYTGSVSYCNVPASSPFIWKKDAAQTIRGTSFEFSINAVTDFQFIGLYTCDSKEYKVELLDYTDTTVWVGYILTEQYQETYKPAPNIVNFSASDGLGLLKDTIYTSDNTRKSLLAIINECLAFTGLGLAYSIGISIKEVRQTTNRSVLAEIFVDASVFSTMKCYDVIDSILGQYNATITQDGCRWLITDNLKIAARLNYSSAIAFESVGSVPSTVVLGQLGNSGTVLYPTGSPLEMSLATAYSTLEITDEYGVKADILPNSNKTDWTNDYTLPGWTPFGTSLSHGPVMIRRKETPTKDYYFQVDGGTDPAHKLLNGVRVDLAGVAATTEEISLICEIGGFGGPTQEISVSIRLTNGTTTYSLLSDGWSEVDDGTIGLSSVPNTVDYYNPIFSKFSISASGFPITGNLSIAFSLPVAPVWLSETFSILLLRNVSLLQLATGLAQSAGEIRTIKLNNSTSAQSKGLKIYSGDVSFVANAKHIFKNYASLADGTPTGQWVTGSITSTTLLNVLQKLYASDNRAAKQILKGKVRGSSIAFDTLVQINYPYTRKFEYQEFSYDLISDTVDVVLSEIFAYQEIGHTIESAGLESSGSSSSSSGGSSGGSDVMATINAIKGIANGLASLDGSGLVPSAQLPSYVDDVLEFATLSTFPAVGETGKIYVSLGTNLTYRWSGSAYVLISPTDHNHSNKSALDLVSGSNSGDQDISAMTHTNRAALDDITSTKITHWETAYTDTNEATSANTASKIVKRDANGSVEIGTEIIKARSVEIVTGVTKPLLLTFKNTSDVKKWFICLGTLDEIEIYNATGVKVLTLTQAGELRLKDEITAFSTT